MDERQFPILNNVEPRLKETVPWDALIPYEDRIMRNHGQSLETLARRGGMSWFEIYAAIYGKDLFKDFDKNTDWREYRKLVMDVISGDVYIVQVEWSMCGLMAVRANSAEEACERAEKFNDHICIPQSPASSYIDESFHVSGIDDKSCVEVCEMYTDEYRRNPRFNLLNDLKNN